MKRYFGIMVLVVVLMLITLTCNAAINFDISVFENNPIYTVEFDDMDDTGEISLNEGDTFFGLTEDDDEGFLYGDIDIKIIEDMPPILRMTLLYIGEDWIFADDVIMKPANTRYTFEVSRQTDVDDGKIYEQYTFALTDDSIGLLKDIIDGDVSSIQYRLDGDRNVDGQLIVDVEGIKHLYNDYLSSGALNNDFSGLKVLFPCEIK